MLRTSYNVGNEELRKLFSTFLEQEATRGASEGAAGGATEEAVAALLGKMAELHDTQWSRYLHNIIDKRFACPHACRYCYMQAFRTRVWKISDPTSVADVEDAADLLNSRSNKGWARVRDDSRRHVIMFPTSHDIIPQVLPAYIAQATKMMDAGHAVLVVSKPHLDVMTGLADAFERGYKDRVIFRLTIGSTDPAVLAFWEPGAPTFAERLAALRMLHERGFVTSVSVEPYLSDPRLVVAAVGPFVSETIWIGPMSGFLKGQGGAERREQEAAWLSSPAGAGKAPMAELMSVNFVRSFVMSLASHPKVYWKTAVMKMLIEGRR